MSFDIYITYIGDGLKNLKYTSAVISGLTISYSLETFIRMVFSLVIIYDIQLLL